MEGDGFSDPRRRAARRPRGGASRGGGRGGGARGRGATGRGRGQQHARGSQKRATTSTQARTAPNLGSNEYRFRSIEEDEEENAYDAGVDFQEAASQQMYDPASIEDLEHGVNLSEELSADFSKLESVLASVPLWVRLGEHTRFALGVPEEDKIENYLDPMLSEDSIADELDTSKKEPTEEFLKDLASISFDDENMTAGEGHSKPDVNRSSEAHAKEEGDKTRIPAGQKGKQEIPSLQLEEPDDFDKWLDEI